MWQHNGTTVIFASCSLCLFFSFYLVQRVLLWEAISAFGWYFIVKNLLNSLHIITAAVQVYTGYCSIVSTLLCFSCFLLCLKYIFSIELYRAFVIVLRELCSPVTRWCQQITCVVSTIWGRARCRFTYHLRDTPDLNKCQVKSLYPVTKIIYFSLSTSPFQTPSTCSLQRNKALKSILAIILLSTSNIFWIGVQGIQVLP